MNLKNNDFEAIIESFEDRWPDKEDQIEQIYDVNRDISLLTELVVVDLELKIKDGQLARVEQYLDRFPQLGGSDSRIGQLIQTEYFQRKKIDPSLGIGEYVVRFPASYQCLTSPELHSTLAQSGDSFFAAKDRATLLPNARDRFSLESIHAEGGLGTVWSAQDRVLNRRVAIKEVKAKLRSEEQLNQRLILEAAISGKLEHPGIVPIHDRGQFEDGRPFYAMRFVEGKTMAESIESYHAKPPERLAFRKLLGQFMDVCNTIDFAHSKDVIHRDIKPQNIMLGNYGETLVVDWGLAKELGSNKSPNEFTLAGSGASGDTNSNFDSATKHGDIIGTPGFMSPEQAAGDIDRLSTSSDTFSLGATLYYILNGHIPKTGSTTHIEKKLKPLQSVYQKAMHIDPQSRYKSAGELGEDIERFLADEPLSVHKESMTEWISRFGRLYSQIITLASAALLIIAIGTGFAAYEIHKQKLKADTSATEANFQKERAIEQQRISDATIDKLGTALFNWLATTRIDGANNDEATRTIVNISLSTESEAVRLINSESQNAESPMVAFLLFNFAAQLRNSIDETANSVMNARQMVHICQEHELAKPYLVYVKLFLARLLVKTNIEEAAELAKWAFAQEPSKLSLNNRQTAWYLLSVTSLQKGSFEEAIETIDLALQDVDQTDPKDQYEFNYLCQKGSILFAMGEKNQAEELVFPLLEKINEKIDTDGMQPYLKLRFQLVQTEIVELLKKIKSVD